jgi:hypothetical protein
MEKLDFKKEAELQGEASRMAVEYIKANPIKHLPLADQNLIINAYAHGYYMGKKSNETDK